MVSVVKCPTCTKPVEWNENSPWKPFCSERCKLIDLGEWASESHSIPGEEVMPQTDDEDPYSNPY
ncbi:MAG: DNA gyrase inhibitor YacG [Gammaproteobacteria bacterium]|nr:DNA gyrase inhibitor YacG [Gammaproteobacteria bacterium]